VSEEIALGRVVRVQGLRGEVRVNPYSGDPEILSQLTRIRLSAAGERAVERGRVHKNVVVLKFAGIDGPEAAQGLIGQEVFGRREDFPEPSEDEYYWHDLIGCRVYDQAAGDVGVVEELMDTGAHPNLVIRRDGEKTFMVPFVDELVTSVDLENRRIDIDMPPGLLEL
jgi:16S rRNA processing protein RimM